MCSAVQGTSPTNAWPHIQILIHYRALRKPQSDTSFGASVVFLIVLAKNIFIVLFLIFVATKWYKRKRSTQQPSYDIAIMKVEDSCVSLGPF
jgi:nitric oxide reductase large subunit